MSLSHLSLFIFLIMLSLSKTSSANDLSTGSGAAPSQKRLNNETKNSNCPKVLVDWVQDDFSNKVAGGISLDSEAHQCLMEQSSVHQSPEQQGQMLKTAFKDIIHGSYQDKFLNDCQKMNQDLSKTIQTRFYTTGARIESANMMILDEISFYDSLMPKPIHSEEIQCSGTFPRLNNKCKEYKKQILNCSEKKEKRLEDIVNKTESNLRQIIQIETAHKACVLTNGKNSETCQKLIAAIELIKSQTPWIKGEVFAKYAGLRRTYARNKSHYSKEKMSDPFYQEYPNIKEAIEKQIATTRKDLLSLYSDNTENFRCLSYSARSDGKNCDFSKTRTQLLLLPTADESQFSKNKSELQAYWKGENCFLNKGEAREKTKTEINEMARDIALTIGTSYLGAMARATYAIKGATQMGKRIAQANIGLGLGISANELKNTYARCENETKILKKLSLDPHPQLENFCVDSDQSLTNSDDNSNKLTLEVARENETNCLLDVLLSAPDVLPFIGAIPGLALINKKRKAELDDFVNRMINTDKNTKDLPFAGALNDSERIYITKALLNKKNLTPDQEKALLKAHSIGGSKGFGEYTKEEAQEKKQTLLSGGFTNDEANTLLRKGIAGSNSSVSDSTLIRNRVKEYFGPQKNITLEQIAAIDRITKNQNLKPYEKLDILREAEFEYKEAMEIIKPDFHNKGKRSRYYAEEPAIKPDPITPTLQKNLESNRFVTNANAMPNIDLIRRSDSLNYSPQEVKQALFEYANQHNISGGSYVEKASKALNHYVENFLVDLEKMKSALNSDGMVNEANKLRLSKNFETIKQNCTKIKTFALLGGYNGESIQRKIQTILDNCK